jgi:hypothetical protein
LLLRAPLLARGSSKAPLRLSWVTRVTCPIPTTTLTSSLATLCCSGFPTLCALCVRWRA